LDADENEEPISIYRKRLENVEELRNDSIMATSSLSNPTLALTCISNEKLSVAEENTTPKDTNDEGNSLTIPHCVGSDYKFKNRTYILNLKIWLLDM
jgi:ABC-type metal ion transport system substrate-binding protein